MSNMRHRNCLILTGQELHVTMLNLNFKAKERVSECFNKVFMIEEMQQDSTFKM